MDFWRVIGANPISDRATVEAAISGIRSRLASLELAELVEFRDRLDECLASLDSPGLAEIPIEMPGYPAFEQTEDHFLYARCACVLAGEDAVRAALDDELSFARFVAVKLQSAETLLYVAETEFESRTGRRM